MQDYGPELDNPYTLEIIPTPVPCMHDQAEGEAIERDAALSRARNTARILARLVGGKPDLAEIDLRQISVPDYNALLHHTQSH
jgi:hypothetical protein